MKIKRRFLTIVVLAFLLASCRWQQTTETVNVTIDHKRAGWYFLVILNDSTRRQAADAIKTRFKDSSRIVIVRVKDFNQTIVSPYDDLGYDLSATLKFPGVSEPKQNIHVFAFYNPSQEELISIKKWTPEDLRVYSIRFLERVEYNRYVKDLITQM